MPIEAEFKTFSDESGFRTRFLVPLLQRLGFISVYDNHGPNEFGKDIIFGEIDRFGSIIYHGMQAKYQDSVGLEDSHDLITSASAAFSNPFRHRTRGTDERIVSFFVANAGNVSTQAEANFFNAINRTPYAAHVRLLNGKTLLDLDRWATINRAEQVGEVLSGLLIELGNNNNILVSICRNLHVFLEQPIDTMPPQKLRTTAFSHYIQKPLLPSQIDTGVANQYLTLVELINDGLDRLRFDNIVAMMTQASGIVEETGKSILGLAEKLASPGGQLESAIKAALATLGPLAAL